MKRTFNKSYTNRKYRICFHNYIYRFNTHYIAIITNFFNNFIHMICFKRKMTNTSFTDGFCAIQKDFNTTIKTIQMNS